jgi:hypothetical protein
MARATRRRFLETFADRPVIVIPAHFPTPSAGWIRSHDKSFRFHLIEVPDLDAALSWASRCPGARYGTVEVRPVWVM